jgi:hypothetical protein
MAKKTKKPAPPIGFMPMAPMGAAIVAAESLAQGNKPEEILKDVRAAVAANPKLAEGRPLQMPDETPAQPAEAPKNFDEQHAEEAQMREYYTQRYLLAYLRLATGQIHNLSLEEMDDCAQVSVVPGVGFETWLKKKGFAN